MKAGAMTVRAFVEAQHEFNEGPHSLFAISEYTKDGKAQKIFASPKMISEDFDFMWYDMSNIPKQH